MTSQNLNYRLLYSRPVVFGMMNKINGGYSKILKKLVDMRKSENGRVIINMIIAKPSHILLSDEKSIMESIYDFFCRLSTNQKIGMVVAVGAVVVASIAGVVTYFYRKNKGSVLEIGEIEELSEVNVASSQKSIKIDLERKMDMSVIEKIHIQNCTVSEAEVRELISGLIRNNNNFKLEYPIQRSNYAKSLPDINNVDNLSEYSNSSRSSENSENNINGMDMGEKNKGSVKSKNSVFSSVKEFRQKVEKRKKKYDDIKKKLILYEQKMKLDQMENQKSKEELEQKMKLEQMENQKRNEELEQKMKLEQMENKN